MILEGIAPAKINLYLDVLDKMDNGYHNIESVMQSISLADKLTLELVKMGGENTIEISTNTDKIPNDEGNLVYKAASLFIEYVNKKRKTKISDTKFVFTIEKNIPVSAGMAGGSTDCACALRLLNSAYSNILKENELFELGTRLGADVGFCLIGGTCECRGNGSKIKKLTPFKDIPLVCAIDSSSVSTPQAFKMLDDRYGTSSRACAIFEVFTGAISQGANLKRICSLLFNKFENVIIPTNENIKKIKDILLENGAIGALMSGSGPSVFGIFETEDAQNKAYNALQKANINAFLCKTL